MSTGTPTPEPQPGEPAKPANPEPATHLPKDPEKDHKPEPDDTEHPRQ
jgi:hypothetical protein